eukprot:TRINITY_DN3584_c0_g1_i1.p1 TRINITY_DN3584_c0_g1~~TRINITY_DN3584_c0_g1_i1.p1  ORF type:complete len:673 (+),score=174.98 TRINITY_DN3584_c0_g1_i1:510-2528(+)
MNEVEEEDMDLTMEGKLEILKRQIDSRDRDLASSKQQYMLLLRENTRIQDENQTLMRQCSDFYERLRFIHVHMNERKATLKQTQEALQHNKDRIQLQQTVMVELEKVVLQQDRVIRDREEGIREMIVRAEAGNLSRSSSSSAAPGASTSNSELLQHQVPDAQRASINLQLQRMFLQQQQQQQQQQQLQRNGSSVPAAQGGARHLQNSTNGSAVTGSGSANGNDLSLHMAQQHQQMFINQNSYYNQLAASQQQQLLNGSIGAVRPTSPAMFTPNSSQPQQHQQSAYLMMQQHVQQKQQQQNAVGADLAAALVASASGQSLSMSGTALGVEPPAPTKGRANRRKRAVGTGSVKGAAAKKRTKKSEAAALGAVSSDPMLTEWSGDVPSAEAIATAAAATSAPPPKPKGRRKSATTDGTAKPRARARKKAPAKTATASASDGAGVEDETMQHGVEVPMSEAALADPPAKPAPKKRVRKKAAPSDGTETPAAGRGRGRGRGKAAARGRRPGRGRGRGRGRGVANDAADNAFSPIKPPPIYNEDPPGSVGNNQLDQLFGDDLFYCDAYQDEGSPGSDMSSPHTPSIHGSPSPNLASPPIGSSLAPSASSHNLSHMVPSPKAAGNGASSMMLHRSGDSVGGDQHAMHPSVFGESAGVMGLSLGGDSRPVNFDDPFALHG